MSSVFKEPYTPTPNPIKPTPPSKRTVRIRIRLLTFAITVAVLLGVLATTLLTMQKQFSEIETKQNNLFGSVEDVRKESKNVDAIWQSLPNTDLLSYESVEQNCIKTMNGKERVTCLPKVESAKLGIARQNSEPLATAKDIMSFFTAANWQKRNANLTNTDKSTVPLEELQTLPTEFNGLRVSFQTNSSDGTLYCASFIYRPANAETPGWQGYLMRCLT